MNRRVAALALCTALACVGTDSFDIPTTRPGPYDDLPVSALERLEEARADWETGQLRLARARLVALAVEHPRNIPLGILVQEVELEILSSGGELPDLELFGSDADWSESLRRDYRDRAEATPTPERLVLAARVESDLPAARVLLVRATAADPECAWAHYGIAHLAFREEDFGAGNAALDRALAVDPGNLAARRLQTRSLARSAKTEVAARAHERWLEAARASPFVHSREVAEAEFDLALLYTELGQIDDVEDICARLVAEETLDRAPVYLVLAAARIADGDVEAALEAARRASRLEPLDALAHVQRALILEDWQNRPDRAYDAWVQALEVARGMTTARFSEDSRPRPATMRDAQLWLQARTRLARLERAGVTGSDPSGTDDAP